MVAARPGTCFDLQKGEGGHPVRARGEQRRASPGREAGPSRDQLACTTFGSSRKLLVVDFSSSTLDA